ncbi:MAG: type IV secretion system protein [Alphaproteobacteria bacterium]|nr:type IV secretion system protein [Alphaproteobacteria bacterium]
MSLGVLSLVSFFLLPVQEGRIGFGIPSAHAQSFNDPCDNNNPCDVGLVCTSKCGGNAVCKYPSASQSKNCTYNENYDICIPSAGTGIISKIVANIQFLVSAVAMNMYETIRTSADFQLAVRMLLTLYVAIYAIMFLFGLTQLTLVDFMIRSIKVGIVALILSPSSWIFFYSIVGNFFQGGRDELIQKLLQIALGALGAGAAAPPGAPFAPLDNALANITSAKMHAVIIATFLTGPYGLIFGLLILYGLGSFAASVVQVMWIYLMSVVVMAFLFALAPLFFAFFLFSRTRGLFDGWINQLVSVSLQPVFMFAFFAFFSLLVQASLANLLALPVCKTKAAELFQGTPFGMEAPRFMNCKRVNNVIQLNTCQEYGGPWRFTGADFPDAPVFPLSIVDVLIFLIIVQLAWRFNGIAVNIAKDISGAITDLNMEGAKLVQVFEPFQKGLAQEASKMAAGAKDANKEHMEQIIEGLSGHRPKLG